MVYDSRPPTGMNTFHDYESYGTLDLNRLSPVLLEQYSGAAVVGWHGKIERQLVNALDDAEKGRNYVYADKVREFLRIWRQNEITGSVNRETLETLKAAADVLAVDNWNLQSYFSSLRDQLRILVASEEELPRGTDMNQNEPSAGMPSMGGGAPPMSPEFGPEKDMPGEGTEGEPPPPPGQEGGGAPGEGGPGAEDMTEPPSEEEMPDTIPA
jgi:hypothetical protein